MKKKKKAVLPIFAQPLKSAKEAQARREKLEWVHSKESMLSISLLIYVAGLLEKIAFTPSPTIFAPATLKASRAFPAWVLVLIGILIGFAIVAIVVTFCPQQWPIKAGAL